MPDIVNENVAEEKKSWVAWILGALVVLLLVALIFVSCKPGIGLGSKMAKSDTNTTSQATADELKEIRTTLANLAKIAEKDLIEKQTAKRSELRKEASWQGTVLSRSGTNGAIRIGNNSQPFFVINGNVSNQGTNNMNVYINQGECEHSKQKDVHPPICPPPCRPKQTMVPAQTGYVFTGHDGYYSYGGYYGGGYSRWSLGPSYYYAPSCIPPVGGRGPGRPVYRR